MRGMARTVAYDVPRAGSDMRGSVLARREMRETRNASVSGFAPRGRSETLGSPIERRPLRLRDPIPTV
jgi:hypothetical protein